MIPPGPKRKGAGLKKKKKGSNVKQKRARGFLDSMGQGMQKGDKLEKTK